MPKSRNPESYPYAYAELVKHVQEGKPVTLEFNSKSECERTRFDIYGYKGALAHAKDDLAIAAARMMIQMSLNPKTMKYELRFTSTLDSDINSQILEAIAIAEPPSGGDNSNIDTTSSIEEPGLDITPHPDPDADDEHEETLGKLGYGVQPGGIPSPDK